MAPLRTPPLSFVGGELSPRMLGRVDDPRYQSGARRLLNMLVEPTGAARNRPGTEFVRAARGSQKRCRMIPYRTTGGEALQVELGLRQEYSAPPGVPGYVRFHKNGLTVLLAGSYDAAHTYAVGELVLASGVLYASRGSLGQAPPNVTYWRDLSYKASRTFASAAPGGGSSGVTTGTPGSITFGTGVNHGLATDEPIEFTGTGTAPGGLSFGVVYYAIVVDPETIQVAAAPLGAPLAITTTGTGTHTMHRRYQAGNLVSSGGSVYYCRTSRPIDGAGAAITPGSNEVYWYLEPASGEYELPTTLAITEDELFQATYSQEQGPLSIAAPRSYLSELLPTTDAYGFDLYVIWRWVHAQWAPLLPAPSSVAAVATKRGATLKIASTAVGGFVNTQTEHHLLPGVDSVYIEGSAEAVFNDEFWSVADGAGAFQFRAVDPETGAPAANAGSAAAAGTARATTLNSENSQSYVVTAVGQDGRESVPSAVASCTNNIFVSGALNTITWAAVAGAVRYRVYRLGLGQGLYGLLGETEATTFRDDSTQAPLTGQSPPKLDTSLTSPVDHTTPATSAVQTPRAVGHFEGRRAVGGSQEAPQDVWLTVSNTESDLSFHLPIQATDRIKQRIKAKVGCTIRHLLPLGQLLVLTDTAEIQVSPVNTDALTPDSFAARAQSYVGAAPVQPEVMDKAALFAGARGGRIFEIGYQNDLGGFLANDICIRAQHLFDGLSLSIVQLAVQRAPVPILWAVSSDGRLLGCTYIPAQQVLAWHQHATDGFVESVSVGTEGREDRVYLVVRRTVNGSTVRYIERTAPMSPPASFAGHWFLDCALQRTGSPVTSIAGLSHLEGRTVAVFADGLVQTPKVVASGTIQLDAAASTVLVGLPMTAQLQTLPAAFPIEGAGGARPKSVNRVWLRVDGSAPFTVGISFDAAELFVPDELAELPPGQAFTGEVSLRVGNSWGPDGTVCVQQTAPLPLTIVSLTAEMALGD